MGKKKDSGTGENIRVVVRCRNLQPDELERGDKAQVRIDLASSQVVVQHPIGDPDTFAFDAVFNNTFSQRDIFLQEVQPLVDSVLQGYNATVFAYGQSGSGKTYTMTGDMSSPALYGMMPQAVDYLFSEIGKMASSSHQYKVKVCFVELYNGKSRDLLAKKEGVNLEIKTNMANTFFVKGAEIVEVHCLDDCKRLFDDGTRRRTTAATQLNEHSSRSHALFTLTIEQFDFEQDPSSPIIISSKINLVDLAGSEKLSKTNATGDTAKEGCNINLSLSALATVIDKIVKNEKHIPYRASPLTMLLKDSLGGNSKTVMFANVGPSEQNISETISTLRFAERAKQIKNKPIKNLDPKDALIQELRDKIEELQKRLGGADLNEEEKLKGRIEELEVENAELRGNQEKDTLQLEELVKTKSAQVQQLMEAVQQRDHDLKVLEEGKALMESNFRNDLDHAQELKAIASNFLRSACSPDQLQLIKSKMPPEIASADEQWDVREIQFYLDGFLELYQEWRHSAFTQEDLGRELENAKKELEATYQFKQQQLEHDLASQQNERAEEVKSRGTAMEALAQMKADLTNAKDETAKLREKVERDQEKFKKKVEKMKEDSKKVADDLEAAKNDLANKEREIERMKKLMEELGMRSGGTVGGGGTPMKWPEERGKLVQQLEETQLAKSALETRLKETHLMLRRKGISVQKTSDLATGGAPPPIPDAPDGETLQSDANDAFILTTADDEPIDTDLLGMLQQQIRIQHRLHELRHSHQRKLEDLLRKYELLKTGKVTEVPDSSGIPPEVLEAKIAEATSKKSEELAALKEEYEKTTDKLVKKLNKKVTETQEMEAAFKEERAALEEERAELKAQSEELTRCTQQMAVELEKLRGQNAAMKNDSESETRKLENEIAFLKAEMEEQKANTERMRKKLEEQSQLAQDFERLQQQHARTEASLKEKLAAIDNNRQMIKWSNSLLDTEKKRVIELEEQIRQQERQFHEMEENWRLQLIENTNRQAAANNKRLEEQAAQYQELVAEEQEKQKLLREKVRKAKQMTQKAAQKFDEMVLENEMLRTQFEELKVSAMKIYRDKQAAERAAVGPGNRWSMDDPR